MITSEDQDGHVGESGPDRRNVVEKLLYLRDVSLVVPYPTRVASVFVQKVLGRLWEQLGKTLVISMERLAAVTIAKVAAEPWRVHGEDFAPKAGHIVRVAH